MYAVILSIIVLLEISLMSLADQNASLCSIISATDVTNSYSEWKCTSTNQPIGNPCTSWSGIVCSSGQITSISLGTVVGSGKDWNMFLNLLIFQFALNRIYQSYYWRSYCFDLPKLTK